MNRRTHFILILVALALVASTATASAWQGESPQAVLDNSFTYQGYLTDSSGTPVHDSCDFVFSLYDAATAGTQIGTADNKDNVQVEHGQFTVRLNDAGEFGSQPFDGNERYLQISVSCPSVGQSLLSPRQPLRAAPYAIYALNVPDHDHAKETWTSATTGSGGAVLTLDNTGTLGSGLIANGTASGYAVLAEGAIKSTADSVLYISPHTMVSRGDNAGVTIGYADGGSGIIWLPTDTVTKHIIVPISTYGRLFGVNMYIKSLEVCYQADDNTSNNYIGVTSVYQNSGVSTSDEVLIFQDNTNHSYDQGLECYSMTAPTPRAAIDNTTWIQFEVKNQVSQGSHIYITTVKITLTEEAN